MYKYLSTKDDIVNASDIISLMVLPRPYPQLKARQRKKSTAYLRTEWHHDELRGWGSADRRCATEAPLLCYSYPLLTKSLE